MLFLSVLKCKKFVFFFFSLIVISCFYPPPSKNNCICFKFGKVALLNQQIPVLLIILGSSVNPDLIGRNALLCSWKRFKKWGTDTDHKKHKNKFNLELDS